MKVSFYARDGVDFAMVELMPWRGAGLNRVLDHGPVAGESVASSQMRRLARMPRINLTRGIHPVSTAREGWRGSSQGAE